ncbi:MFS transporter [Sphingobium sufflavum]|uniref:MDR family MFS transporter n=1 Tax=Sphingobium sufflavum TaxID=1129547 RepID=UPI001F42AE4D|nr:MDR family MFS transporter [Sphingobium sufflavum]MCE7797140.1 MFS transporter [Sphingobium sufflavum]
MNTIQFSETERRYTIIGILIVFLLSALDQTIVSTAMPRIAADLNGLELYSWVTSAYLLTSTVMVPIWGKLCDLIGRKPVLLASILFFVAGSWLSGLSGEFGDLPLLGNGMTQLVIFRAVQGIGGGGLFTTAFTIIADIYPPDQRARIGGMLGAVFGLASAIGPLIGGYFTDHGTVIWLGYVIAGWRWVFYVNLPLSLLSLFIILFRMPRIGHRAEGRLDIPGALLIVAAVVPMLLALTWGGQKYAWDSAVILGLGAGSAAALIAYVVAERYAADPIVPVSLFRNPVFSTANLAAFLVSMSFMSAIAFLPLFMQLAQGITATASGLLTLPLMAGLMISAIASGPIVARTGAYKTTLVVSLLIMGWGLWLLSRMAPDTSQADLAWRMLVLGVGLGPAQSLFGLIVQNATPAAQRGVVTSASQFFRQIGSTMGVAIFGTILTGYLNSGLSRVMPGMDFNKLHGMGEGAGHATGTLPAALREPIATALTNTFALGIVVVVAALVVTLFIPVVILDEHAGDDALDNLNNAMGTAE